MGARGTAARSNPVLLLLLTIATVLSTTVAILVAHYGFGHDWVPTIGPGIPSAIVATTILYRGYRH